MEAAFMMHKDIIVDCSSLSVIRKKGESQNGGNKKTKHAKFSEKKYLLPPDTHKYMWKLNWKQKKSAHLNTNATFM